MTLRLSLYGGRCLWAFTKSIAESAAGRLPYGGKLRRPGVLALGSAVVSSPLLLPLDALGRATLHVVWHRPLELGLPDDLLSPLSHVAELTRVGQRRQDIAHLGFEGYGLFLADNRILGGLGGDLLRFELASCPLVSIPCKLGRGLA